MDSTNLIRNSGLPTRFWGQRGGQAPDLDGLARRGGGRRKHSAIGREADADKIPSWAVNCPRGSRCSSLKDARMATIDLPSDEKRASTVGSGAPSVLPAAPCSSSGRLTCRGVSEELSRSVADDRATTRAVGPAVNVTAATTASADNRTVKSRTCDALAHRSYIGRASRRSRRTTTAGWLQERGTITEHNQDIECIQPITTIVV
jgi:hypothetical protein